MFSNYNSTISENPVLKKNGDSISQASFRPNSSKRKLYNSSICQNKSPYNSQRGSKNSSIINSKSNRYLNPAQYPNLGYTSVSKQPNIRKNLQRSNYNNRMNLIRNENDDQNEEIKVNASKVRLSSKSKSTNRIANYEESKQNMPDHRRQGNIFDKNKDSKKLTDHYDLIKSYISILIKSIQMSKIYKIKSDIPETSDSISLSVSKGLTKLLSLSLDSSSSLCLSFSSLCKNLPCDKEIRFLILHVKKLILLGPVLDNKSSLQPKEDCWLKNMIIEMNDIRNLNQIEIEAEVFDYWKSILRVEKLRGKGIQVCLRNWLPTFLDSIPELINLSTHFNFCIKDWILDREMSEIGDLYIKNKMATLEYSKLNKKAIQLVCDVLNECMNQPLNIRFIGINNNCCFSQFDLCDSEEKNEHIDTAYEKCIDELIKYYDKNEPNSNTIDFFHFKINLRIGSEDEDDFNTKNDSCIKNYIKDIKDQWVFQFCDKIETTQNIRIYKFIAEIKNEKISFVHLRFLFAFLENAIKIVFTNCILTFKKINNFEKVNSNLKCKTRHLVFDKCTYICTKPEKSECSKNLSLFLTQTNQIEYLDSIRIVDHTSCLDASFEKLIKQNNSNIEVIHEGCKDTLIISSKLIKQTRTKNQFIDKKITNIQSSDNGSQNSNEHAKEYSSHYYN